ncbi:MAG TPA: glycosyltransferase family 2 protein [Candidatus Magasanikbacteria bacterium]|nr:glycosyltransferase family 2 protein [Candidatus Magasanikbacteria bacterium]
MKLSVITVTWKNESSIGKQIESVQGGAVGLELEQIIVDNGSTDSTIEIIKKYPQVKLIQNKENLGFGAANNQGYKIATGDYILFLNPDNEIEAGSLDKVIDLMEKRLDIGLLSCKLIKQDGAFNEEAKPRRFPKLIDQLSLLLKVPHLFPKVLDKYLMKDFNPEIEQEVETVRGAFMLLRKKTLDKLGWGFDPRYFIWFEDIDLCREIKKMNLKVIYTPIVTCVDLIGQSFVQRTNLWKQKNFTASMLKYFQKWEPWYMWIWIAIFRPVAIFMVWLKEKMGKNNSDKIRVSL